MNNLNKLSFCLRVLSGSNVLNNIRCLNGITYNKCICINQVRPSNNVIIRYTSTNEVRSLYRPESLKTKLINKIKLFIAKNRLKVTGYILFESIADHINYADIFQKLHLSDTFYSWFVITELHIWMLMVRYMAEGEEGRQVRNRIVEALWTDVNHRAKKLGAASPASVRVQVSELSEQLHAALISYDEGLQSDDIVLAGALWRRIYQQKPVNPEHLDALVKYVRRQIKLLDNMTKHELFEKRQINWEPFKI